MIPVSKFKNGALARHRKGSSDGQNADIPSKCRGKTVWLLPKSQFQYTNKSFRTLTLPRTDQQDDNASKAHHHSSFPQCQGAAHDMACKQPGLESSWALVGPSGSYCASKGQWCDSPSRLATGRGIGPHFTTLHQQVCEGILTQQWMHMVRRHANESVDVSCRIWV